MFSDSKNFEKENIIKEIEISKTHKPIEDISKILIKRYEIWKNIYTENKNLGKKLLLS